MRICKFEIRNFKGIQNSSFEWEDIIVLIGENNAGKSTALQALQFFLSGSQLKDIEFFHDKLSDQDHAVELIGHFCDLSPVEQQTAAVRGRMFENKWILKKRFWSETQNNKEITWKEQYYSYSSEEIFLNWPENDRAWGNFPEQYQAIVGQLDGRGPRPTDSMREQLRELVRQQYPALVGRGQPGWSANPGGGGNWKSNANSIIPRCIYVKAVHDATDESTSKEASSYGKIVSLIIEKKMMQRPEILDLKNRISTVLRLFNPDPEHPEMQAEEIRDVQQRINARLNQVIGGTVSIRTSDVEVESMLLPSTYLVLKDHPDGVELPPVHQGHGLQRSLVMTLLQILAEIQTETVPDQNDRAAFAIPPRLVVLAVEEPELYMHPQMERKMRDVLYQLAEQPGFQVICTTHSPVFLDVARAHKTIVRTVKSPEGRMVKFLQVSDDIFAGQDANPERERISLVKNLVKNFHPTVNEVFFAKRVVLLEESSALVAFARAAELTGVFDRHPNLRRDVTLIDCDGKGSIPMFQRVLNKFEIPYTVIHDEDRGNQAQERENARIESLLDVAHGRNRHLISPTNLEGLLSYVAAKDKPYRALKRVEELHNNGNLPDEFLIALNWVYFGQAAEPA